MLTYISKILPLLLFFFFAFGSELYSQPPKKKISKSRVDISLQSLVDSASYYAESDSKKAFQFIEKVLPQAVKSHNIEIEAECYTVLGKINANLEQYDLAEQYFRKAVKLYERLKRKEKIGEVYELIVQTKDKAEQYDDIVIISDSIADTDIELNSTQRLKQYKAKAYFKKGQLDEAAELYEEVLGEDSLSLNKDEKANTNIQLAEVYTQQRRYDEALTNITNAEQLSRSLYDTVSLLNSLDERSNVFRAQGRFDDELLTRQEQFALNESRKDTFNLSESQFLIADIMLEKNKTDEAIVALEKSIELSDYSDNKAVKTKALKKLSQAYYQKKDPVKAYEVYKKYATTIDELYQKREEKLINYIAQTQDLNRKIQRIDVLEEDLKLSEQTVNLLNLSKQLHIEKLENQRWISWGLFIVLLGLAVAGFFVYKSLIAKREANQLLALKSLRSQMNPHFIFNALNSVNNYIAQSDERSANKYLSDFSRLMRSVMENSKHDFVHLSQEIEIIQLYLKLEHSRFPEKFDFELEIDDMIETDNYYIPPMLLQPYIENAVWHGLRYKKEKGYLKVVFTEKGDFLEVIIEDNGIGRTKSSELKTVNQKKNKSTGIKNIENRLKIINQIHNLCIKVTIEDLDKSTTEGTRICVQIPPHIQEGG